MARISDSIRAARAAWNRPGRPRPATREIAIPKDGQESVWDFPRPPRLESWSERVKIEFAGATLADTNHALRLLETSHPPTYYVPMADVNMDMLRPAGGASMCEWKGQAAYFDVVAPQRVAARAAWSYPDPFDDFAQVAGHLAFYCAAMDGCWVGGHQATPQPGGFYGGWVTPHVTGPFKGGPGSAGW
ncbi:MAG: DUF427 domain-containing protein [Nannocystaceae bacterium]|nr:DUF427 domain-containing protein [bacterium]